MGQNYPGAPGEPPTYYQYPPQYPAYGSPTPQHRAPVYRPQSNSPARMPRHRALQIVQSLKWWITGGAALSFAVLTGLAAGHTVGVTAAQNSTGDQNQQIQTPTSQPSDNGGYFGSGGGYGFGSGGSGRSPVTGTGTS